MRSQLARCLDDLEARLDTAEEARLRGEWDVHIGIRDSLIFGLLRDDPRPWRNWSL